MNITKVLEERDILTVLLVLPIVLLDPQTAQFTESCFRYVGRSWTIVLAVVTLSI